MDIIISPRSRKLPLLDLAKKLAKISWQIASLEHELPLKKGSFIIFFFIKVFLFNSFFVQKNIFFKEELSMIEYPHHLYAAPFRPLTIPLMRLKDAPKKHYALFQNTNLSWS